MPGGKLEMMAPVIAQAANAGFGGYALDMLRALLSLAGVCLLAYWVLRALSRRGFGTGFGRAPAQRVEVVERVALEARRSLYLVRVQGRLLLLGTGESGPPGLIAELDPEQAELAEVDGAAAGGALPRPEAVGQGDG